MAKQSVEKQLTQILTDFNEKENEVIKKDMRKAANDCKNDLKNTSPKNTGDYAKSWSVKRDESGADYSYIVHNRKHYQLTHLLEKPHLIRNQFGSYGWSTPQPHIAAAEKNAAQQLMNNLKSDL